MGDSRKHPYHTTAIFLEFQGQRVGGGRFIELEIWRNGDTYCMIGIPKAWEAGGYIWNFHREQTSSYTLKMLILWILESVRK